MEDANKKIVVFCGPCGAGKTTLLKRLVSEHPEHVALVVSHTTREPRDGESDGTEEMTTMIENDEFIEHTERYQNLYGTSKAALNAAIESGKVALLDLDTNGVKSVRASDYNPLLIFVKSPTIDDLRDRLRDRGVEDEDALQEHLNKAQEDLEYGEAEGNFHQVIVNDDFDRAYEEVKALLEVSCGAECCHRSEEAEGEGGEGEAAEADGEAEGEPADAAEGE